MLQGPKIRNGEQRKINTNRLVGSVEKRKLAQPYLGLYNIGRRHDLGHDRSCPVMTSHEKTVGTAQNLICTVMTMSGHE